MRNMVLVAVVLTAFVAVAAPASAEVSLAGVHWYSGSCFTSNSPAPAGERGWNVESVIGSNDQGWINESLAGAQAAAGAGLRNIIRIDFRGGLAVPKNSWEYAGWANEFWSVANQFKNQNLATVFIVGNEPNVEGCVNSAQYASAFNYLFSHGGRPAGVALLAAGPATYSPNPSGAVNPDGSCAWTGGDFLTWFGDMSNGLNNADGFAIHTYGGPYEGCPSNPSQPCSRNGWPFDAGFQSYKQQIGKVTKAGLNSKPIYITEFNTDVQPRTYPEPIHAYPTDWINLAFQDVRNYNATTGNRVKALAWFVDRNAGGGWADFALINIPAACQDTREEFANPANRPGTVTPGDNAEIQETASAVQRFLMPGEIRRQRIRVRNSGTNSWPAFGWYRLATGSDNSLMFSAFPQCGGYANSLTDGRVYLCSAVGSNAAYDFLLDARAPTSGTSARLSVQMVRDGVAFFGETERWGINLGTAYCGTACTQCILNARPDILPFYAANGWNTSCGNRDAIVNNWCAGLDPAACNALKTGTCASFCNGCRCSYGSHLDGTAIDPNGTFCGYRVCGMDRQIYECRSDNRWWGLGTACR